MPLLEAMSSGVCCVTTPVGVAIELVRDGENAFMAALDDAETFVRRTAALATDPEQRKRMAQAARQTILDGYRWEQTTQSAWDLYRTAIDRFHRRLPEARVPYLPERDAYPAPRRFDELSAVPPNLKSWVRAKEHITFMQALQRMGAIEPASRLASQALRTTRT